MHSPRKNRKKCVSLPHTKCNDSLLIVEGVKRKLFIKYLTNFIQLFIYFSLCLRYFLNDYHLFGSFLFVSTLFLRVRQKNDKNLNEFFDSIFQLRIKSRYSIRSAWLLLFIIILTFGREKTFHCRVFESKEIVLPQKYTTHWTIYVYFTI